MMPEANLKWLWLAVLLLLLFAPTRAFSACTGPAGNEGDVLYAGNQHVMVYCNGTNWVAMGSSSSGSSTTFGTLTTNDFCTAASSSSIQCTTAYTGTGDVVLAASPHMTGATIDSGGLTVSAGGANITGTVTGTTFSGSGASLTSIGTTNMTAVTGTPNATTYLRGDNTWSAVSLGTASLTGVVTVPQGGTGDATLTAHGLLVGNGTNAVATTAAGSAGALLLGQGGSADPAFAAMSQDCTITNAGVITCTKTNNVAFGALATASSVNLTSQVSGVLPIANGGTNASSQTTNGVNYFNGTGITSGSGFVYNGSQVGIGTTGPNTTLDVSGDMALRFAADYTTPTGSQNDVALGSYSAVRFAGTLATTFTGIAGGQPGKILYLHNASSNSSGLTLSNQSSSSGAENRIVTGTGSDLSVAANTSVTLQYDGTASLWRVIGGSGGTVTPVGTTGQVQYNSGSNTLAANQNFTWIAANNQLVVGTGASTPQAATGTVSGMMLNVIPQSEPVSNISGSAGPVTVNSGTTGQMAYYSGASTISGTPNLYVSGSNIGIGTNAASYLLSLDGQSARTVGMQRDYTASTAGQALTVQAGGAASGGTNLNGGNLILSGGISTGTGTSQIQFQTYTAGSSGSSDNTAATAMMIAGNGSVGIGTTSPAVALDIYTTTAAGGMQITDSAIGGPWIQLNATNATASNRYTGLGLSSGGTPQWGMQLRGGDGQLHFWDGVNSLDRMVINPSGNVGIGTTGPATYAGYTTLALSNSTNGGIFDIMNGGTVEGRLSADTGSVGLNAVANIPILFSTNSSERMRITNTGNVGIGTTSPTSPLTVNGGISTLADSGGNGYAAVGRSSDSLVWAPIVKQSNNTIYEGGLQWTPAGLNIDVGSSLTNAITILNSGNVGIGTTSPVYSLQVRASADRNIAVTGPFALSSGATLLSMNDSGSNAQPLEIRATTTVMGVLGNVGIANTNPSYILDVSGQARFTGGYTTSDRRWKTNVEPLQDSLSLVSRLQGVSFDWKRKEFPSMHFADGKQIGFIAQDVEKILPAIVSTDNQGFKNLSYESITPVLVEAVKELKADNDNLAAQIKAANDNLAAQLKGANDNHTTDAKAIEQLRRDFDAYQKAHP